MKTWLRHWYPRLRKSLLMRLNRAGLLAPVNFTSAISLNGRRFLVPVLGGTGLRNVFMSEMWMIPLLARLLSMRSGAFVDVGVNIGQTLLKLRSVSECPWIGFEPNPECVQYVHALVRANDFKGVLIVPVGIYRTTEMLTLNFYAKDNQVDTGASLVTDAMFRTARPVVSRRCVPVFEWDRLRSLLPDIPAALIKIDVEGAEVEVLTSMETLIRNARPMLLLEILPLDDEAATQQKYSTLVEFLFNHGYGLHRIVKRGSEFLGIADVDRIGFGRSEEEWDYLALTKQDLKSLEGLLTVP